MEPLQQGAPRETARRWLSVAGPVVSWKDTFYRYAKGCYHPWADRPARGHLDNWLEQQMVWASQGPQGPIAIPYRVRKDDSMEILDHARTLVHREGDDLPIWDDGRGAEGTLLLADGILDTSTRRVQPHTPSLFEITKLPFAWGEGAPKDPPARWLEFLAIDWSAAEIETAQEFFGYCLANHRRYQKFLILLGPPRSGKGVLLSILSELVGRGNTYPARMGTFSSAHLDEELATKQLIVIPDARKGNHSEGSRALEFILTFTGNDDVNLPRKYKSNWRGKPRGKLAMATNELIGFQDSSNALGARAIILERKTSFVDRENTELESQLRAELRAIFFWALEGLDRLTARGHFDLSSQPADLKRAFAHLSNPVANYLDDLMVLDPAGFVSTQGLFEDWLRWCKTTGTLNSLRQIQLVAAVKQHMPGVREASLDGVRVLKGMRSR